MLIRRMELDVSAVQFIHPLRKRAGGECEYGDRENDPAHECLLERRCRSGRRLDVRRRGMFQVECLGGF
jgi:hypothetical protein